MIPPQPPEGGSAAPSGAVAPGAALARPLPWGWCVGLGLPLRWAPPVLVAAAGSVVGRLALGLSFRGGRARWLVASVRAG